VTPRLKATLRRTGLWLLAALIALGLWVWLNQDAARRALVTAFAKPYEQEQAGAALAPRFEGADAQREQLRITLQTVATGIEQPTDIQFPPGTDDYAVVLEKTGTVRWLRLAKGLHGKLLHVEVVSDVEEGLLGLAFHPDFAANGRLFIGYVARVGSKDVSRIAEWHLSNTSDLAHAKAKPVAVLLELEQPYQNHNGGQLAFGPDGYLYAGFGDGGFRDDPHGNGQNRATWLGSMLRIDVNSRAAGKVYGIPRDNPFVGKPGYRPETWAIGLRNPWRYSFDTLGRLVIADVGQDAWEEISVAEAGDNLGWNIREAFSCRIDDRAQCDRADLVAPVFAYGREDGASITGGFVYTGERIAALRGLYVFGDFVSGRLFAIALPRDRTQRVQTPIALGKWPIMPSAFGRDHRGELYVANLPGGEIYRLDPVSKAAAK
jgi:glucose/arabinose dehydrogenase